MTQGEQKTEAVPQVPDVPRAATGDLAAVSLPKRNTTIKVVKSGGFVVIELVTPKDEFVQIPLRKADARKLGALLNKAGL